MTKSPSWLPDTLTCYKCEGHPERKLTGKTMTSQPKFDPTEAYELTCGHWMI